MLRPLLLTALATTIATATKAQTVDCSNPVNAEAEDCIDLDALEGITNFAPLVGAGAGILGLAAIAGGGDSADGTTGTPGTPSTPNTGN